MNVDAYFDQLVKLLPRGDAWQVTPDTRLGKLLMAFADGAARFDAVLLDLMEEADPRTATELIDAWETCVGLPDGCTGALTEITDRRAAVWQKLTGTGGQSRAYFIEVASRLGYMVEITEYRPAFCTSLCTATLFTSAWRYVWKVTVADAADAPVLECVLSRLKPAHTVVFFEYEGA